MWSVEPECQKQLDDNLECSAFEPIGLPDAVVRGVFTEPLWHMQGRVNQLWAAGVDLGPKIRVVINDMPTVGACAIPDTRYPVVTVNAGTCVRLRQLIYHAVRCKEVFTEREHETPFPDSAVEESLDLAPATSILEPVDLTSGLSDTHYFAMAAPLAPTAERQDLANALTIAAFDFLVMHEIAHILRNQVRFRGGGPLRLFPEGSSPAPALAPGGDIILEQLLELDADLTAGPETARQFAGGRDIPPMWERWTTDKFEILNLWLVSLALTFFLLDTWARKSGFPDSHPEPRDRLTMIMAMLAQEFAGWHLTHTGEEGVEFAMYAYQQAVEIWLKLGLPAESATLGTRDQVQSGMSFYISKLDEYGIRPQNQAEP
jgi:hypothetical protein